MTTRGKRIYLSTARAVFTPADQGERTRAAQCNDVEAGYASP
jgi:hypothetical protein